MEKKIIKKNLDDHFVLLKKDYNQIIKKSLSLFKEIKKCIKNDGKILIFGNGGSASDAQHFSTELTVRLKKNRIALPAMSLSTDTSALTAIGNDLSFNKIFSRQLEALSKKNDLIIPITTSGNSKNILEAVKCIKNKNFIFGILGNDGGLVKKYCKDSFIASHTSPSRVQEIHILFWHSVCEIVENYYAKNN